LTAESGKCQYTCKFYRMLGQTHLVNCACGGNSSCPSFQCKPHFIVPLGDIYVDDSLQSKNNNLTGGVAFNSEPGLVLSRSFRQGTNDGKDTDISNASSLYNIWTLTVGRPLITTTSKETTEIRRSSEEPPSTIGERSTAAWLESVEVGLPWTTSDESSSISPSSLDRPLISTNSKERNEHRRSAREQPSASEETQEGIIDEPSYQAELVPDGSETVYVEDGVMDDVPEQPPDDGPVQPTKVPRCPCSCIVNLSEVVCDCVSSSKSGHRCDLRTWVCSPGTYKEGTH